jgi:hypothetical protein
VQPGLVEAALWHPTGGVAQMLFQTDQGIAMIQQVLSGPLGGDLLICAGQDRGWSKLDACIKQRAERWQDWKDIHGNSIAHWLSYSANKNGAKPTAKSNRSLAQKFPNQMTEINDQGYSPVDFMPTVHAEVVATKMIKKASTRTKDEKRAAASRKKRVL